MEKNKKKNGCFSAKRQEELNQAYQIRHIAYSNEGYFPGGIDHLDYDLWDSTPYAFSFLTWRNSTPIGTMRLVLDSELGLPLDQKNFSPFFQELRDTKRKLAEACKLAFLPKVKGGTRKEHLDLERRVFKKAEEFDVDDVLLSVSPKIARLYQKMLLFEPLSEKPIAYDTGYKILESVPMRVNLRNWAERLHQVYGGKKLDLHKHFFGKIFTDQ